MSSPLEFNGKKLTPITEDLTFNGKKLTPIDAPATTQYSGGFNQPEKDYPFKNAVDTLKWAGGGIVDGFDYVKKIPTGADFILKNVLSRIDEKANKAYKAKDMQQEAIDAMKDVESLNRSSLWSEQINSAFRDQTPETINKARVARQEQLKAYNEAFKKRGLGVIGSDGANLFLITKDGKNLPLDNFIDGATSEINSNKGSIAGSIAGAIKGAKYAPTLGNPILSALSKGTGATIGGAIGAGLGSFGDTALNSYVLGKKFDSQFALDKAKEEAIADGVLSLGGEVLVGTGKQLLKGGKAIKNYLLGENLTGAKKFVKESNLDPKAIHEQRSQFEDTPIGLDPLGIEKQQDELASTALTDAKMWDTVGGDVIADPKASASTLETIDNRANSILKWADEGSLSHQEVADAIQSFEKETKDNYKAMVEDLQDAFPDYRASNESLLKTIEDVRQSGLHTDETISLLNKAEARIAEKDTLSIEELFKLREIVNKVDVKDYGTKQLRKNINEEINNLIGKVTDELPEGSAFREGFTQLRDRYSAMIKMQDNELYDKVLGNLRKTGGEIGKSPEEAFNALYDSLKDTGYSLNGIAKNMTPQQLSGLEMGIVTNLVKKSILKTKDGLQKTINFNELNKLINEINPKNIKSIDARQKIEKLKELGRIFSLDAQALSDLKGFRNLKGANSGIATTIVGRLEAMRVSIFMRMFKLMMPSIAGNNYAFARHVVKSLRKARSTKELVSELQNFPDIPPTIWKQLKPIIEESKDMKKLEQEAKLQQEEADRIAREERIAKLQAEKEVEKQKIEQEVVNFKQPSKEETDVIRSLSGDDRFHSFSQKIRRILDGSASDADKRAYIEAKSKIGDKKLSDELDAIKKDAENLNEINKNKAEYDSIVKQISGEPEKIKSKTQAEIDSLNSEDAQAEAYSSRFNGNEYDGTNYYGVSKADEKAWLNGTASNEQRERIYNAIQQAKEDGFKAEPVVSNPIIKDIVQPKVNHIVEPPKRNPIIQGTSTAEQSQEAMKELQKDNVIQKKANKPRKQKTYSEDEDVTVSDEMTDFKKELLDETGIDEATLTSSQSWNKTGKVKNKAGTDVEMGIADYAMRKVNNELLAPSYPKGFTPDKNIVKGSSVYKDSYDIFRGRSVAGRMDGKKKAYIDGLVFDVIEPEKSPFKPNQFIKTTGDKYAVAQGISSIVDDTFPKLAEEADIVIEPYGASLSFVSNLNFAKKMLRQGKDYHVSVSSYFEPEKSLIYNAIKQGNGKEITSGLSGLLHGEERGQFAKELRKLFTSKTQKGYSLNRYQVKTALEHFHVFEEVLSYPNLHLMDKLDNHVFNMAKKEANKGTKVVFIDDSNYASLPYERSGDVYNDPLEGFKQMVKDGQMSQADLDKTVKFAKDNSIPLDDQFGKNPQYLLWQKQETYDALTKNNGIIIGTNNASPELVRGLSKYDGNIKVFWHQANHVPDQELGIAMRNKRPEYLAIFGGKNGTFTTSNGSDSLYKGTRFDDFGTTSGSNRPSQEVRHANNRGITESKQQKANPSNGDVVERGEPTRGLEKSGTVKNSIIDTILNKPITKEDYVNKKLQVAASDDTTTTYPTLNGQTLPKSDKKGNYRDPYTGDVLFSYDTLIKAISNKKPNKKDKEVIDFLQKLGL